MPNEIVPQKNKETKGEQKDKEKVDDAMLPPKEFTFE